MGIIRDSKKIYAETNDPNAVIATGILTDGQLIVGAGNKGIKTISLPSKSILYTDANGILKTLSYNSPNKYIGTDEDGSLVLKDNSEIINELVVTDGYYCTRSISTGLIIDTIKKWSSIGDGISVSGTNQYLISFSSSSTISANNDDNLAYLEISTKEIIVSKSSTYKVIVSISINDGLSDILLSNHSVYLRVKVGTGLTDIYVGEIASDNRVILKEVVIPAGTIEGYRLSLGRNVISGDKSVYTSCVLIKQ